MIKVLRYIVDRPWINLIVGLILIVTSSMEAWDTLKVDLSSGSLGAHHGVMVFGIFQVLKTLPDLLEGLIFLGNT